MNSVMSEFTVVSVVSKMVWCGHKLVSPSLLFTSINDRFKKLA